MVTEHERAVAHEARVFFALWPDNSTAQALHDIATGSRLEFGGRPMRRDTLHLTLAFMGKVRREEISKLIAVGRELSFAPFQLRLDLIGEWRRQKILWIAPERCPAELAALVVALRRALGNAGYPQEDRDFRPHVTLLRNLSGGGLSRPLKPVEWRVDEFVLVESMLRAEGAHYEVLARWAMR